MPARRHLLLDDRSLPTGEVVPEEAERGPLGDRVLDDHYEVGTVARFAVAGGGREIAVSWDADYTHAQVFAPDTLEVVCLEPMMAPVAALSSGNDLRLAAPGTSASARFDITVT